MPIERTVAGTHLEVLDRVLDKGIIIDAWLRASLAGIDLVTVQAFVVVSSIETYLKYADVVSKIAPISKVTSRRTTTSESRVAEDVAVRIIRDAFEAWNAHDVERYVAQLDEGYVGETHTLSAPFRGRKAARAAMRLYLKAFPDLHFSIEGTVAIRDDVVVSWLAIGTNTDTFVRTPPEERWFQVHGCTVSKLKNRKIVHAWNYWDTDDMLRQLRGTARGSYGPHSVHRLAPAS